MRLWALPLLLLAAPLRSAPQKLSDEGSAALRALLVDPDARRFYEERDYSLAWVSGVRPTLQARALIRLFQRAAGKGLDPGDYDAALWNDRLLRLRKSRSSERESNALSFDAELTACALRYGSDLSSGRADPKAAFFDFITDGDRPDIARFLREQVVDGPDAAAAFDRVEPPFPAYRRTLRALKIYRGLAASDSGEPLPQPGKIIRRGMRYGGAPRLRDLLARLGDFSSSGKPSGDRNLYDRGLAKAVRRFQRRHGLDASGDLDSETLARLNVPLKARAAQLGLTLERWRWAPRRFPRPPLVVNIPEFRLHTNDEDYHWGLSMKVVVGRAYEKYRTPIFQSEMKSIILRPYWNVPQNIQREELAAEIEKDPAFLTRNNYEVLDPAQTPIENVEISSDILAGLRSGELSLRQKPGAENSLGLVKFNLPNKYDVYLHGTPAQELFAKSRRDFSHGCIRVEDPFALAAWALRDQPQWSEKALRAAAAGDQTLEIALSEALPVVIVYGTAVVMEDGEVRFYDDIYGYDAALEEALKARRARLPAAHASRVHVNKVGVAVVAHPAASER